LRRRRGSPLVGILVLMILIVLMNSAAIWLRNRFERKW
jgi:ABC-type phosphate transport system permease subunit